MRAIKIRHVSAWSIAVTIFIGAVFAVISVVCSRQFQALQEETERYIQCEDATREIQDSATYLAEQVRLYAETGMRSHMDNYITEIETTQRSQNAYDYLQQEFGGTEVMDNLQKAMQYADNLQQIDLYVMRLMAECTISDLNNWPRQVRETQLDDIDANLQVTDKQKLAQELLNSRSYRRLRQKQASVISAAKPDAGDP